MGLSFLTPSSSRAQAIEKAALSPGIWHCYAHVCWFGQLCALGLTASKGGRNKVQQLELSVCPQTARNRSELKAREL